MPGFYGAERYSIAALSCHFFNPITEPPPCLALPPI
jgi:hypothetical protein